MARSDRNCSWRARGMGFLIVLFLFIVVFERYMRYIVGHVISHYLSKLDLMSPFVWRKSFLHTIYVLILKCNAVIFLPRDGFLLCGCI